MQLKAEDSVLVSFPVVVIKYHNKRILGKMWVYCGSCPRALWKGWRWQERRVVTWYPVRREMTLVPSSLSPLSGLAPPISTESRLSLKGSRCKYRESSRWF